MEETTITTTSNSWLHDAIKKGLILGAIHIVVFLILYIAAPSKLTGFSYVTFIIILNVSYCIIQGIAWRKEVGGYLEYGAAFKYLFVLLTANGLLNIVFTAVFLLVDPTFPEMMAQSQMDTSFYWAEKMGAPEEALDKMQAEFNIEEIAKNFSFVGLLRSFGIGLILYAVGAAIFALFVRKQQPETF